VEQQLKDQLLAYRQKLTAQIQGIDEIIAFNFPAAENGQPQKPRRTPKTPAVATDVRPRARRRASAKAAAGHVESREPKTLADAIRESARHLVAPWARTELVDYLEKRFPELLASAGSSSVSSTLCNLAKKGEFEVVGERPGLTCPLTTYKVVAKPED
jgi:predicted lipid-binding transport protein (Tim44 family)